MNIGAHALSMNAPLDGISFMLNFGLDVGLYLILFIETVIFDSKCYYSKTIEDIYMQFFIVLMQKYIHFIMAIYKSFNSD